MEKRNYRLVRLRLKVAILVLRLTLLSVRLIVITWCLLDMAFNYLKTVSLIWQRYGIIDSNSSRASGFMFRARNAAHREIS